MALCNSDVTSVDTNRFPFRNVSPLFTDTARQHACVGSRLDETLQGTEGGRPCVSEPTGCSGVCGSSAVLELSEKLNVITVARHMRGNENTIRISGHKTSIRVNCCEMSVRVQVKISCSTYFGYRSLTRTT